MTGPIWAATSQYSSPCAQAHVQGSGLLCLIRRGVCKSDVLHLDWHVQDLADSVSDMSKANDWFLVAPDFTDYMRAQVSPLRHAAAPAVASGLHEGCHSVQPDDSVGLV